MKIMTENQLTHQQIRQNKVVLIALLAFLCSFVHNALPNSDKLFYLFPLSGQGLSAQSYVYFLMQDVAKVALTYCVYLLLNNKVIKYFLIIDVVLLADYLLTYDSFVFSFFFVDLSPVRIAMILKAMIFINYLWGQSR